jgi:hypothetical protein
MRILPVRLAVILVAALAAPLSAQPAVPAPLWHVPLDVSQGAVLERGTPTPYSAAVRLQVARGFGTGGAFRIGPAGALLYRNPQWEVAGGVRASVRVMSLNVPMLSTWGLYLAGEQLAGTGDSKPGAASLVADLGLLRMGVWVVRDWEHHTTALEASLGVGLNSLIPLLRPAPPRGPPVFDHAPPPAGRPAP